MLCSGCSEPEVPEYRTYVVRTHACSRMGKTRSERWWPSLRRFRDFGYCAAIIQFVGATLFSASTIISVPHVLPSESSSNYGTWDATFWTLQVRTAASYSTLVSPLASGAPSAE